jgi:hypothetical protein
VATFGSTGGTYFDVLLDTDGEVLINGTKDEIRAWVIKNVHLVDPGWLFIEGESLKQMTHTEYMYPEA